MKLCLITIVAMVLLALAGTQYAAAYVRCELPVGEACLTDTECECLHGVLE